MSFTQRWGDCCVLRLHLGAQVDAFLQLLYPERPEEWKTWILTRGKTAELVDGDIRLGKPSYLSDEVSPGVSGLCCVKKCSADM